VLASNLLDSGFSCVLQMPTGSGKTWLAECAIEAALTRGARAVYLSPLKALAAELGARWRPRFAGSKVGIFTGDYGSGKRAYPVSFDDARLLVMTPERLDACTRAWRSHWSWIPEVDLVVVDEIHLLGDRRRGPHLEGALSRLRRLNPFARVLGLSATLGNLDELTDWLDGVSYRSDWRPVPLTWRVVRYKRPSEKPELLAAEVARNCGGGGKSLVFVQSRRRAEELSRYLVGQGLPAQHHHAGLDHPSRGEIERAFRDGPRGVLVATSTLEMGLNLPARQVVLYDLQEFDGEEFGPLWTNSVWQRAGRAGRPGLDEEGETVLLAPTWDRRAEGYLKGEFEPILSGLSDVRALAGDIVAEVASGLSRTAPQVRATFSRSLAARQHGLPDVDAVVAQMRRSGMLRESDDENEGARGPRRLKATRLGHVAARHLLSPATVLTFRKVLEAHPDLTFLDALVLASSCDDSGPVLPVDFEELDGLAQSLSAEPSRLLRLSRGEIVELLGADGKRLLSTLKMALAARDWTRLSDTEAVAERHDCYPFEVEMLKESLARLLTVMHAVLDKPNEGPTDQTTSPTEHATLRERLQVLRQMVSVGLDEWAATLTLVGGVGPKTAKKLVGAGVNDLRELAGTDPAELTRISGITRKRAIRLVKEAAGLLLQGSLSFRYRETAPPAAVTPPGCPPGVDVYRLRRALDLKVMGTDGGWYYVRGGLEPHVVRMEAGALVCDCADAENGNLCKHVLKVRMHCGERALVELAQAVVTGARDTALNLLDLWSGGHGAKTTRSVYETGKTVDRDEAGQDRLPGLRPRHHLREGIPTRRPHPPVPPEAGAGGHGQLPLRPPDGVSAADAAHG
jgi:helicase